MSQTINKYYGIEFTIPNDAVVKVVTSGNIKTITYSSSHFYGNNIVKIDKDHYCDYNGEVHEYNHYNSKTDNIYNVKNAVTRCRDIINTNFNSNETLFITLTYTPDGNEKNSLPYQNNYEQVSKDMHNFMKRLKYHYSIDKYLYILEPTHSGLWHSHLLITNGNKCPFIANEVINNLWGLGFTKTIKVTNVSNLGLYLTAFITDVDIEELPYDYNFSDNDVIEKATTDFYGVYVTKAFLKGARLPLYPKNKKFFVTSKNIKKPEVQRLLYGDIKSDLKAQYVMRYNDTVYINDDKGFENFIRHEEYELKHLDIKKDDPDCSQNHLVDVIGDNVTIKCPNYTADNEECQYGYENNRG